MQHISRIKIDRQWAYFLWLLKHQCTQAPKPSNLNAKQRDFLCFDFDKWAMNSMYWISSTQFIQPGNISIFLHISQCCFIGTEPIISNDTEVTWGDVDNIDCYYSATKHKINLGMSCVSYPSSRYVHTVLSVTLSILQVNLRFRQPIYQMNNVEIWLARDFNIMLCRYLAVIKAVLSVHPWSQAESLWKMRMYRAPM